MASSPGLPASIVYCGWSKPGHRPSRSRDRSRSSSSMVAAETDRPGWWSQNSIPTPFAVIPTAAEGSRAARRDFSAFSTLEVVPFRVDALPRELAAKLEVREETVSRWENEKEPIGATSEKLLRLIVAQFLGDKAPALEVD